MPAESATLGPLDAIYTRIGAADDLAGGRSTFMVEMTEAAYILNRATPESLVLIDEIGRGTSTFDGLSLAWAIAHRLAERNRCLALFATHYFELTALATELEGCANVHFDAAEHKDGIVFLHAVADGAGEPQLRAAGGEARGRARRNDPAGEGLPGAARPVLGAQRRAGRPVRRRGASPPSDGIASASDPRAADVLERLIALDPDALSPREALDALYALKKLAGG